MKQDCFSNSSDGGLLDGPDVDLLGDDAPVCVVVVGVDDVEVLDVLVDQEVELALAEDVVVAVVRHRAAARGRTRPAPVASSSSARTAFCAAAARVRRRRRLLRAGEGARAELCRRRAAVAALANVASGRRRAPFRTVCRLRTLLLAKLPKISYYERYEPK